MKFSAFSRLAFVLAATLALSVSTRAALSAVDIDGNTLNGTEGVYDSVLDVTWLADANLAMTNTFGVTGIDPSGNMQWNEAEAFINAMNAGGGYLGVKSWRHPSVLPLDGSTTFNTTRTDNGASDIGYNLSAPVSVPYNPLGASPGFIGSELAYHYYNNFGGIGHCNGTGTSYSAPQINCVSSQQETVYGIDDAPDNENNKSLFSNIINKAYWSGTELDANNMFLFSLYFGDQFTFAKNIEFHVWAVADGNLAAASAVPIPAAAWLFASGLIALIGARKLTA